MTKLKTLCVIGISALIAGTAVGFSSTLSARDSKASAGDDTIAVSVNRTQKSDRLVIGAGRFDSPSIATVEVVGVRDAAIVYRDRDGRLLYRSDPLSNATLITKGVVLPEVTIREAPGRAVQPVTTTVPAKKVAPVDSADRRESPGARNGETRRTRIPEGCDAAASPIAAPQMAHILSKCLVAAPSPVKVASLY
ncbi:MAG: hypothetical protein R3D62_17425 [Xanthobacteraceae bacterium]